MPQIHKSRTQRVVFKNNIEYNPGYDPEDVANKETITLSTSLTNYPSSGLVKAYVDACLVGLLDDRGSYDASGDIFPSSGGSGTAGAILKGDLWFISVGGTLGGTVVYPSYSLRALVDAPGQTASNWNIINLGLGFTPENSANKVISISAASTDTQYPSAKLVYDQLAGKQANITTGIAQNNIVKVSASDVATGEYARFTATGLESKTGAEVLSDIGAASAVVSINEQTDSYTLVIGDASKLINMNKADANILTIPKNSSVAFAIGTTIAIRQMGAGATTIAPIDVDVTLNSANGLILSKQFSIARIIKIAADTWAVAGDLKAS